MNVPATVVTVPAAPVLQEMQLKLIDRIQAQLKGRGLSYAIKLPQGLVGDLEIAEPLAQKKRHVRVNNFKEYELRSVVGSMGIGEVRVIPAMPEHPVESLRSVISSTGSKLFGPGNFTTCIRGNTVECLREA